METITTGPDSPAGRTRILLVSYSQSGDVERAAESFLRPLRATPADIVWERLKPEIPYPSPWRNVYRFFNVMPECVTLSPPPLKPLAFDLSERFDLVVIAYQVWFLSPSLPVQAFFQTPQAAVLRGTKILTISVSRNMWQSASETMKQLIARAGGTHIDNIVLTHQGPAWATFVTTTRLLLWGKKDRLWGVFPPAGIRDEDFASLERFGAAVARQLDQLRSSSARPLLRGLGAVRVDRRYVFPELIGSWLFRAWGRAIRAVGGTRGPLRAVGVIAFLVFLVLAVVVGIPLVMLARLLIAPLVQARLSSYIARLQLPSGECTLDGTSA